MSVVVFLVALSCGMLLAAIGLALGSSLEGGPSLARGAQVAAWGAAGVLMVGALLGWGSGLPALESLVGVVDRQALEGPILSLILMAALAIPLRVRAPQRAPWSSALLYLPGWLLALAALTRIMVPEMTLLRSNWVTPIRFSLAVCGGLGARALGQSFQVMVTGVPYVEWPGTLTFGLTTLLVGSAALVNLWQRGSLWGGVDPVLRGGMTGAWLAWGADWLAPPRHPRLQASLTMGAALLLMLAAVRPV